MELDENNIKECDEINIVDILMSENIDELSIEPLGYLIQGHYYLKAELESSQ